MKRCFLLLIIITLLFVNCIPKNDVPANQVLNSDDMSQDEVAQVVDKWLELWATYDLNLLDQIFYRSENLSYFSSEKEGLMLGYDGIIQHHTGFGFVAGGNEPDNSLWLEDIEIQLYGASAVVGAIWFFGDKLADKDSVQQGPVTFVLIENEMGDARIIHTHFANYELK